MNKREIILDFTSLLDVIMIILFFFILFSHFETAQAKLDMQEAQQAAAAREEEASRLLDDAGELMLEAQDKDKRADEKLSEAELAGERSGKNAQGINDFSNSRDIRVKLNISGGSWQLEIFRGEDKVSSVKKAAVPAMSREFMSALSLAGCDKDDTLLCTFIYNGMEKGTNSACEAAGEMFGAVKKEYPHFFYSEIDTSLFEEE